MRGENNAKNSQAVLKLTAAHRRQLRAEAEAGYPEEICGFLIGSVSGAVKTVTRVISIENAWDNAEATLAEREDDFSAGSRRRRFALPPDEFYRADKAARAAGESILGFYHSHPDSPAIPSHYDLQLAQEIFPGYSYIIVSVLGGQAAEMTCWVLTEDSERFEAEPIGMAITADDEAFLTGIDRVLWEIWDPIGVNDTPEARDEYRGYAPEIAALLAGEASDAAVFRYLEATERETMGLPGSGKEHLNAVIAHLRRFAEGQ